MPLPERDISVFPEITLAYLNRISGNEITLRDPTIEFQSLVFSAYTGLIHLRGKAEGFVYFTASQQFLVNLANLRRSPDRYVEDSREVIKDLAGAIVRGAQDRFAGAVTLSEPRIFSTVPDDPIEMPPAVFVQPLFWRKEYAYLVLGLSSPETSEPLPV